MKLQEVKITPAKSAEMLGLNTVVNRRIKQPVIERYVREMQNGDWDANNGEVIKFTKPSAKHPDGELVDGQHRLMSIIAGDITITLPVLYGVSKDAFYTIDTGSNRTFADVLSGMQVTKAVSVAGAVAVLYRFYSGDFKVRKNQTHKTLYRLFISHRGIEEYTHFETKLRNILMPSDAIFVSYIIASIAPRVGLTFLSHLASGGAPKDSAVHICREALINYRINNKKVGKDWRSSKHWIIGSIFKAWNHQQSKSTEPFKMLQLGEDLRYPIGTKKAFPDIEVLEILV